MKRRKVAEKSKLVKKRKNKEKNKQDEIEMWSRLKELNTKFKDIKKRKKRHRKKKKEKKKSQKQFLRCKVNNIL